MSEELELKNLGREGQPDGPGRGGGPRDHHDEPTVIVTFNRNPLGLPHRPLTGAEIKDLAIREGSPIQPSYVLFVVRDHRHRQIVGDGDLIDVHEGMVFAAVADDDNS